MNRFDVAEAVAVLSWDYGLYGVWDHIQKDWRIKPRPNLKYDTLTPEELTIYHNLEWRAEKTGPWDRRLVR